jgi:hypothetical protein
MEHRFSSLNSFLIPTRSGHLFPPQHNHDLHPFPRPTFLLLKGTSSSSSKKQAGYASPLPISPPIKLPKLDLQPSTAAAVVGLASAVSSDQRLRSGFCWPAIVEPGDVDIDEREVVLNVFVVADELEDKIRSEIRRESRMLLPLPLLMLVLGKREVLLKERLALRG